MKIYLDTIGCRLNQSEIEAYARQFRAAHHTLVATPQEADLAVINTCTVTAAAASDSRQKVRWVARAGVEEIALTGCWSTMSPEEAAVVPAVRHVIHNEDKDHLVLDLLQVPEDDFDLEPVARQPIPGARLRTRAFVKVQDGCDNRCTFCITTLARGRGRSRPIADILDDIQSALLGQVQEIVLTGVHLGSWGMDFPQPQDLSTLVKTILKESEIPRLRLSSIEPWDLDDSFFELWQNPRLCRHIHMPLQSGCEATLRRMARKTTPESFAKLVESARAAIPQVAITTDVIVGFPGEIEADFTESLDFLRSMQFAGGHVFTYSARPGTAAAEMPDQIPHPIRKERNALVRDVLEESAKNYRTHFLGQVLPVLWESATAVGPQGWRLSGLTDNYLRVKAQTPQDLWNRITPVQIIALDTNGLQGQIG
jgi:threonylcarbamoyladenosine tRNA methylthiotransferase MtaB